MVATPRKRPKPQPARKRKLAPAEYLKVVKAVRRAAGKVLPPTTRVVVVSRGDDALLALGGCMGGHFPQTDGGAYAGCHPADDREAVGHLEAARVKGATHLLIPRPSFWWLDHYRAFRTHLKACYREVHRDAAAIVFDLAGLARPGAGRSPVVDVIVPVYRDAGMTRRCLESVLRHGGGLLGRVIVVDDASPDPDMPGVLDHLAGRDPRVRVLTNAVNLGFVASCNRGLAERAGDAVLLNSDTLVTAGWLDELAHVARSEPRVSCVSPLSNNATVCSVPKFCAATPAGRVSAKAVREACAGLPRSTPLPTGVGFCMYLRGDVLDLIGGFDPAFGMGYNEENDWCMRAQILGFTARRANRAFVYHLGSASFSDAKTALDRKNARTLEERHPHYPAQVQTFCSSLDGHLAAHAVRTAVTGRLRVALDLRHLSPHPVGTNNYAYCLARELSRSPEIDLTLVMRTNARPFDVPARVVHEDRYLGNVEVIHKPSQVFDPRDLELLTASPTHTVITYQDMIAYRAQGLFTDQSGADRYRSLSYLALQAAQATIAISQDAKAEIVRELGVPADQVFFVPHGVDAAWFRARPRPRRARPGAVAVPDRYLLAVGTDFPHKNLHNLLEAYSLFRSSWAGADPPALVLAGHRTSYPRGLYRQLATVPPRGVVFAGAVDEDQLRALYQGAEAFVFPSVYEGFGLPLLEAMAAGTPVVAMRISSVPEVGEEGVLYPAGFSAACLAKALTRVCTDDTLRAELIASGTERAAAFHWCQAGLATVAVYKSVVLRPSERSLHARRHLMSAVHGHAADASPPRAAPPSAYRDLVARIRQTADQVLPPGSPVLVVSKGDDDLLKFARNHGWHFPRTENGSYQGHHPADSEQAIAQLEDLRAQGGRFLLLPRTGFWWLNHYRRFAQHLVEKYDRVWEDADCVIFRLARSRRRTPRVAVGARA